MCLKMARLKTTPALRHCETSHGRYMAVLMQTDVNAVPLSIPGFNCSRGISWNCSYEYVEGALEKLRETHIRKQLFPPWVRGKQVSQPGSCCRTDVFLAIVYFRFW